MDIVMLVVKTMAKNGKQNKIDQKQLFLHKGFALMQLKNAVLSLKAIEQVCSKCAAQASVVPALIRDAVVQYGSIYKFSNVGKGQKHKLDSSIVPEQFKELHGQLITYRDQLFAHMDIDFRNPVKMESEQGVSWHIDNKSPKDFTEKIPDMKNLMIHIMKKLGSDVVKEHKESSQKS